MKSGLEIAQEPALHPIAEVAAAAGILDEELEFYGRYRAKVDPSDGGASLRSMVEPERRNESLVKGARTRILLRCGLVLVYESAQDVAADEASSAVLRSSAIRRLGGLELQAAVRPVPVVMGGVDAYDAFEMPSAAHQRPVETFVSYRPDPAFGERVRAGSPDRRTDHLNAFGPEHLIERARVLCVAVAEEEAGPCRSVLEGEGEPVD